MLDVGVGGVGDARGVEAFERGGAVLHHQAVGVLVCAAGRVDERGGAVLEGEVFDAGPADGAGVGRADAAVDRLDAVEVGAFGEAAVGVVGAVGRQREAGHGRERLLGRAFDDVAALVACVVGPREPCRRLRQERRHQPRRRSRGGRCVRDGDGPGGRGRGVARSVVGPRGERVAAVGDRRRVPGGAVRGGRRRAQERGAGVELDPRDGDVVGRRGRERDGAADGGAARGGRKRDGRRRQVGLPCPRRAGHVGGVEFDVVEGGVEGAGGEGGAEAGGGGVLRPVAEPGGGDGRAGEGGAGEGGVAGCPVAFEGRVAGAVAALEVDADPVGGGGDGERGAGRGAGGGLAAAAPERAVGEADGAGRFEPDVGECGGAVHDLADPHVGGGAGDVGEVEGEVEVVAGGDVLLDVGVGGVGDARGVEAFERGGAVLHHQAVGVLVCAAGRVDERGGAVFEGEVFDAGPADGAGVGRADAAVDRLDAVEVGAFGEAAVG